LLTYRRILRSSQRVEVEFQAALSDAASVLVRRPGRSIVQRLPTVGIYRHLEQIARHQIAQIGGKFAAFLPELPNRQIRDFRLWNDTLLTGLG
jgi:hypothetical protein